MSAYTYTTLDDPLADWSVTFSNGNTISGRTTASGINNAGQVVGSYTASNGNEYGFLYGGGTYTTIDDPLANGFTVAQGINSTGQIVGYYGNNSGAHGFLLSGGTYFTISNPSATTGTFAEGINDSGQIVGYYADGTGTHGPSPAPPRHSASTMLARSSGLTATSTAPTASLPSRIRLRSRTGRMCLSLARSPRMQHMACSLMTPTPSSMTR